MSSVIAKCVSLRSSPVPSLTAVLSCAVENIFAGDFPQRFHVFLLRVAVSSTNTYTYTYTYTYAYTYTDAYTYTYTYTRACTCAFAFACGRGRGRERGGEERRVVVGGSVGGWVGGVCVGAYVCVVCVVCAESLRSVPQE